MLLRSQLEEAGAQVSQLQAEVQAALIAAMRALPIGANSPEEDGGTPLNPEASPRLCLERDRMSAHGDESQQAQQLPRVEDEHEL